MPTISKFYGILIRMYYIDHNPPHFHAYYNSHAAQIDIRSLTIIDGFLPSTALKLVIGWAKVHQNELLKDWDLAKSHMPLNEIDPLD